MLARIKDSDVRLRAGFTLIELMVVVIIVAILAAAAVPIYRSQVSRAYEAEVITGLAALRTTQRIYRAEFGTYPASKAALEGADLISAGDFVDLRYVSYAEFSVDGTGGGVWNGSIPGYDHTSVTMAANGMITRT